MPDYKSMSITKNFDIDRARAAGDVSATAELRETAFLILSKEENYELSGSVCF